MDNLEFWMVWNPDSSRPPTFQHTSAPSAANEAERLAAANPGQSFYVLHAIEMRRTADAPVEAMNLLKRPEPDPIKFDDGIPF